MNNDPQFPPQEPNFNSMPPQTAPINNSPLSASGRFTRYSFFGWNCALSLFTFGSLFIAYLLSPDLLSGSISILSWLLLLVCYVVLIYFSFVIMIRRLHDLDQSGWLSLLNFVPLANVGLIVYLIFFKGSEGSNRYGPPRPALGWEKVMAWSYILVMILAVVAGTMFAAYFASQMPQTLPEQQFESEF
ncbi:uncharacterized membrane protein YhaH (DUF805 family) [Acinetobacter calcoaceticus]|uniref:Uncharacterized membrane protein YhaH (DUF805 family) n=1 Tax=Acinetobacter calcoaceticus TaxID=471 RepID=A0A4R1Y3T3_ACICA|nr:uncharacterized membrane protein YhaH (DUF805 family) [Acinetobacter calcoaceticus]